MAKERPPIKTDLADIVDPDPISTIDLADCITGALYAGTGGNIGRIAICRGELEHNAGRITFEGYQVFTYTENWRQTNHTELKREAYLPTETRGSIFRPTKLIAANTPSLSGRLLLDWLLSEDLKQAELRLRDLKSLDKALRKTPFMVEEISMQEKLIAHLQSLRLY